MAVITAHADVRPLSDAGHRLPHPLLRATAWSSVIGLAAGLVMGLVTQVQEHDRG